MDTFGTVPMNIQFFFTDIQIFKKLPQDTINVILEFFGKIKYKNGKYINIIHKYDFRYSLLSNIKMPISNKYAELNDISLPEHFEYEIHFNNKHTLRVYNLYIPTNSITYIYENLIDRVYGVYKRT